MQGTDKALLIDKKMVGKLFSTGFLQLRPDNQVCDSRFLYYYISSKEFLDERDTFSTGSTQIALTDTGARQLYIPLPPLREQRRIVTKLEKLLEKVESSRTRLEKIPVFLKRFRQSVLAAAYSGSLTADWRKRHEVEPAVTLLRRIKEWRLVSTDSKKVKDQVLQAFRENNYLIEDDENLSDNLPDTWVACRIGEIGKVCNGSTPSRKRPEYWGSDIAWVSSGEVRNNIILETREKISQDGYDSCSVRKLPTGTVLLAMIGEGKTRGQTAILNIEATINQNIAGIIIDHGFIDVKYLWWWFQMRYQRTREQGSGSGPQALNCQRVRELPFLLPPLPEQHEIVCRVEKLFALGDRIETRYQKAKGQVDKLTQSILAKAFRGDLVPHDPNDEPASELLKRIKAQKVEDSHSKGLKKTKEKVET